MKKVSLLRASFRFAAGAVATASVHADPNGKAAANHIFAQRLVNATMAERSDLLVVGLHGIPPGRKDEMLFACNLDHIGNPDTDLDKAAGIEHMTILEPKTAVKFEMSLPLLDASGNYIGAVVLIFKRVPQDTELSLYQKGLAVRNGLAEKIPNLRALLAPSEG